MKQERFYKIAEEPGIFDIVLQMTGKRPDTVWQICERYRMDIRLAQDILG